jgi:hypothetical protein
MVANLINYLLNRAATTHLSQFAKGFILLIPIAGQKVNTRKKRGGLIKPPLNAGDKRYSKCTWATRLSRATRLRKGGGLRKLIFAFLIRCTVQEPDPEFSGKETIFGQKLQLFTD